MPTPYSDVDSFPNPVDVIDDSVDTPNGSTFNTPVEGALNRTRFLYNNMIPTLTTLAALSALTPNAEPKLRAVQGFGVYRYSASSTTLVDGVFVLTASGGGRWLHQENAQPFLRRIAYVKAQLGTSAVCTTGNVPNAGIFAGPTKDPGRPSGTNGALPFIATSATGSPGTFKARAGDIFRISWAPILLFTSLGTTANSDFAMGVSVWDNDIAGHLTAIPGSVIDPSDDGGGQGFPYINGNPQYYIPAGTVDWTVAAAASPTGIPSGQEHGIDFQLVGASQVNQANYIVTALRASLLCVEQLRVSY